MYKQKYHLTQNFFRGVTFTPTASLQSILFAHIKIVVWGTYQDGE